MNASSCGQPGCKADHTVLHIWPTCHETALTASYDKSTGTLTLRCFECNEVAGEFLLGEAN